MTSLSERYSKWDNIELSDDESDCHPNIDKDSWFRLKHRTRVEREDRDDKEKSHLVKANEQDNERLDEITAKLAEEDDEVDREALEEEMRDLEQAIEAREKRLADMEKNKKWNVDNMCHVVEERTIVSKKQDTLTTAELPPEAAKAQAAREAMRKSAAQKSTSAKTTGEGAAADGSTASAGAAEASASTQAPIGPASEMHVVESYAEFTELHEALLEEFSEIKSLEKTRDMLHEKGAILLQEHAQSYLLLSCLEDEMNKKHERMKLVARQSQILSHVVELSVSLNRPPRDVVIPFFMRISEPGHNAAFLEAVNQFITRIQKRAVDKAKEMQEERERKKAAGEVDEEEVELSKEERMGPGGLDPVEVFETLPDSMKEAFESQETQKLHDALSAMPIEEAKYHMKRCEDSGLWVTNK